MVTNGLSKARLQGGQGSFSRALNSQGLSVYSQPFPSRVISLPRRVAMSGDILGFITRGRCYWHLVGRGQGCCLTP